MRLYDYPASGNCYKVRLLLSLLDREYERVPIDIFAGDTLTPEFARLNPARETPVLELTDGRVLVQSNAILWYLGEGNRPPARRCLRPWPGRSVAPLRAGVDHARHRRRPVLCAHGSLR